MSVSLRLLPTGKRGERKFRVVVQPTRSKLRGGAVEVLGSFDKATKKANVKKDRIDYWKKNGAIVSKAVEKLLHM